MKHSMQSMNQALSTISRGAALSSSTLSNSDYRSQLTGCLKTLSDMRGYFPAEDVGRVVRVVEKAVLALIPTTTAIISDLARENDELDYIINLAVGVCVACDAGGVAMGLITNYNTFSIMCENEGLFGDDDFFMDYDND